MSFRTHCVERAATGFALIRFNRPAQLDTLSIELRREFAPALDAFETSGIRVLIVTGTGRAFAAGLVLDAGAGITPTRALPLEREA